MEQNDLLRQVVQTLRLPYLITGSIATILYGEPDSPMTSTWSCSSSLPRLQALAEAFPAPEFHAELEQIRDASERRRRFNVIDPGSGLKVDFLIPATDAFDRSRFARARRVQAAPGLEAAFAAPEDVILKKLQYYAEGGSEKHLRDIAGILRASPGEVDRDYVTDWARRLGLSEVWEAISQQE